MGCVYISNDNSPRKVNNYKTNNFTNHTFLSPNISDLNNLNYCNLTCPTNNSNHSLISIKSTTKVNKSLDNILI